MLTLDEAIRYLRSRDEYADLVRFAYLGPDPVESAIRFERSAEFGEVKRLLAGAWQDGSILDLPLPS